MATTIALFNHKGGVSKTTTTFHLGWMLAQHGSRVVIVDADPQCNLTGQVLGFKGQDDFEQFYVSDSHTDLRTGLAPAFEFQPRLIQGVECVSVEGCEGLFLLPGSIRLSEYEVTLGVAQELSSSIITLQNLAGSLSYLLKATAERYAAEYVLTDMNPSLSSINQNLVLTSDYFLIPTIPDYFALMALNSLSTILPKWHAWLAKAREIPVLAKATYTLPNTDPKFLGTIIQRFRPRKGSPASAFQAWIDQINAETERTLLPALRKCGMAQDDDWYERVGVGHGKCLALISDFNSLIAKSQEHQTPVFALTPEQLDQVGNVLQASVESMEKFAEAFSDLAYKVDVLCKDAESN